MYKKFATSEDKSIDFSSDQGYGWDFCKDFKQNPKISNYINLWSSIDCRDYLECFKKSNLDDTTQFLETLSCLSIEDAKSTQKRVISPFPGDLDQICSSIAKDFEYLSVIKTKQKNLSLSENTGTVWMQNASPKLSRFILETAPAGFLCIVKQKNSHSIKIAKTIVLNSSFEEFHIRFDGSYISLNSYNPQMAELFGQTSITDIIFAKICKI